MFLLLAIVFCAGRSYILLPLPLFTLHHNFQFTSLPGTFKFLLKSQIVLKLLLNSIF
jgi:hypothetical protein